MMDFIFGAITGAAAVVIVRWFGWVPYAVLETLKYCRAEALQRKTEISPAARRRQRKMTPSADESAIILTNKLKAHEPFVFTKFGDGTLWWMSGKPVQSANGEVYRAGIDKELRDAARTLAKLPHVYFGDQLTCSSGPYLSLEQGQFIEQAHGFQRDRYLHMETLLIHRLTPELLEFYRVLKARQHKLFCGGLHLEGAAEMLGCSQAGWFLP